VFAGGRGGIFRVSPNGGTPEPLVRLDAGQLALGPQLLPGGDAVLFTLADFNAVNPASRWDTAKIVVHSLSSGERTEVVDGGSGARYLPSGHLVYAVSGSLFAQAFNPATRRTSGDRIRILSGVRRTSTANSGAVQFSVSDTGSLVYVPGPANATSALRSLIVSNQSGTKTTLKVPPGSYTHPRVSPDGTRLAVAIDDGQEADISIYDLAETTSIRRLTLEGRNRYPVWSGDGQRVAFQSDRLGDLGIFWQRADGGGIAERLTTAAQDVAHTPESFSRDGKYLLFTEYRDRTYSLHILSMNDKSIAPFGKVTSTEPTGAEFSPDGRWVAYASTAGAGDTVSSNRGIFIQPFPATGAPIQVPKVRVDYHPAWAPDGHSLLFVATAPQPFAVVGIRTEPGVTFEPARQLPQSVPRPLLLSGDVRGYDIMPDGRLISLNPAVDQDSTGAAVRPEIRVVINWFEELKRLVPTH
jgi:dipeptidyl aminopeptidase/acylaminoacyl peptidase